MWAYLDAEMKRKTTAGAMALTDPEKELKFDLAEEKLGREEDPIEWWKKQGGKYKKLSKVALKFVAIPATSVPRERVFSDAGNIVTKKRSRLKDENVRMPVVLNSNLERDALSNIFKR